MKNEFDRYIEMHLNNNGLTSRTISKIQVNVGLLCNLACNHCYLSSGRNRIELMNWPLMEKVLLTVEKTDATEVDITGGAPEMNPDLKDFITALKHDDRYIMIRTNLAILTESDYEEFINFYKDNKIHLIASQPCYLEENVRAQRGEGVYEKNIAIMQKLNDIGYGSDPDLHLDLVYNPGGAFLPGNQAELETAYKKELGKRFGIVFNKLLTITNMPIGRFLEDLNSQNKTEEYFTLLKKSFNPLTIDNLMCIDQVNIGCDGRLYDCDFNHALGLAVDHGVLNTIDDFDPEKLASRKIMTGNHCFGCTAGAGSSCGGALV